jgi:NTE family protein
MSTQLLGDALAERPFALAMSSAFFGFFAHAGMLVALDEAGLAPARLSGSSAGAMIAGLYASGAAPRDIAGEILGLRRADFWDPGLGAGLLRGELFRQRVAQIAGAPTLQACPRPVALSAFDVRARRTVVLTDGDLATAITASCSFPLLLHPVRREGLLLSDGGILDRPGIAGLADQPAGELRLYHPVAAGQADRAPLGRFLRVPERPGTITVRVPGLPRVHPFALERGRDAFELARRHAARALAQPIDA